MGMASSFDRLNKMQLARSRKMKIMAITAVVSVSVIVVLVGLYLRGAFPWLFSENPRYSHSFYLTIEPDSTSDFTIICPVPTNSSGSFYPDFNSEIEVVSGDPEYLLIETEHGYGLQVSGSGYTRLAWEGKWKVGDGDWYLNMTMTNAPCQWNYSTPESGFWSWLYSNNESHYVWLGYSAEKMHNETPTWLSGGGPVFHISAMVTEEGWRQVLLDYGWGVIN